MSELCNQAVVFTKPLHHLNLGLSPAELGEETVSFFSSHGFRVALRRQVTGPELAARNIIQQHYLIYSKAACADRVSISEAGKQTFQQAFGRDWEQEEASGRILPTARLLESKGIDVHQLFDYWNELFIARKTVKLQDGLIMGYIDPLDAYCINAFYPSMEANFYHPETVIEYYVLEFDPTAASWARFRADLLGATNAAGAAAESFRGRLYARFPVEFPGRDNFVHGSAGPLEGLVERLIHEPEFEWTHNPVGRFLEQRGIGRSQFIGWKQRQSISLLGHLFDETEEKNTEDVFEVLSAVSF